jgi:hypothetical protein
VKPFAIWLAIVAVVFGGYALVSASLQETSRVYVFVDASNPMNGLDRQIRSALDDIDDADDSEFALAFGRRGDSELMHTWQSDLSWTTQPLFAPCSFDAIDAFTEATEADERILITTAGSCPTDALAGWTIIELTR